MNLHYFKAITKDTGVIVFLDCQEHVNIAKQLVYFRNMGVFSKVEYIFTKTFEEFKKWRLEQNSPGSK